MRRRQRLPRREAGLWDPPLAAAAKAAEEAAAAKAVEEAAARAAEEAAAAKVAEEAAAVKAAEEHSSRRGDGCDSGQRCDRTRSQRSSRRRHGGLHDEAEAATVPGMRNLQGGRRRLRLSRRHGQGLGKTRRLQLLKWRSGRRRGLWAVGTAFKPLALGATRRRRAVRSGADVHQAGDAISPRHGAGSSTATRTSWPSSRD